ncbi:PKD domain-containing protein [Prolixibacteraceae bacterium Z1-6]|uniref:PKD domain-containing protein n=1 Tax=Draconibacterium aestuarii TaxID=2998507 RepID=A0A9X3J6E9_9BACT|nr:PKD domain-containing protein [Prolixibacteraceae bacterium Z1-6]
MKKSGLLALLVLVLISGASFGQNSNKKFKMEGVNPTSIAINKSFSESVEIFPFATNGTPIYGLDASANIELKGENSLVRLLLIDNNFNEYLIYESYNLLLEEEASFSIENICEETSILDGVKPYSVQIEIENAQLELKSLSFSSALNTGLDIAELKKEKKKGQNEEKINKINKNLKKQGKHWVAGTTSVSELSYGERKKLYGQSTFPAGFEYYAGGVITASATESTSATDGTLKSATTTSSPYVDEWDWRDRHGKNWITSVTDQSTCGSCWAFAATGATEAMTNLYYNQQLNLDLSEQDLVSCSGAGDCVSGYPAYALDYIQNNGIVDEATFPYSASDLSCAEKGNNPQETIKIGGRINFGTNEYPKTEDVLKDMLIKMGPLSSGQINWAHAMVLVGYKEVKEGDIFYYHDLDGNPSWEVVTAQSSLIGKTVWIYKNSWGAQFGDNGYVYLETTMDNVGWTHALITPFSSINNYQVKCEDRDGDGFYWWGLGPKPATCTGPDTPDGNDADATLGPLDNFGHCTVIGAQPMANFSSDGTSIVEGKSVQFTDLSENALTREWTFEGGTPASSTSSNPLVLYNTPGIYNVTLTAYNKDKSDTKTIAGFIIVTDYVASYCESNGDASKQWIESVQFGSQMYTSGSSGATGYQDLTNHTYNVDPGSVVSFTLTPKFSGVPYSQVWRIWIDYNGDLDFDDSGELVYTSNVTGSPVSQIITIPSNLNIKTGMRVSMKRSSSASPCEIFTEGEVEDYTVQIGSGTPTNNSPVANFSASNTAITRGETVTFSDLSTNTPTSWSWTFEGGTPGTSMAQNPSVTYSTAGTYSVSLTATNADGSDTKTMVNYIVVTDPVIPAADFSADKTSITTGESVSFSDLSTDATSRTWTFEGGTPGTSTAQNPLVTYSIAGTYSVSLTATNAGGSDTKTMVNYIVVTDPVIPVADFSADKTSITTGESVSFSDLSTDATSRTWTFEGGTPGTSTAQNPAVTYNTAGTYSVSLTATNAGGSDTKTMVNYIEVTDPIVIPVADFSSDRVNITTGESVTFSDLSTDATSRTWTFTGGTPGTSTAQNPTVTYNSAGIYKVSLTATNGAYSDTKTVDNYIQVTDQVVVVLPAADFSANKTTITAGESVSFSDLSSDATSWNWTFAGADKTSSTVQNPLVTYSTAGSYDVTLTAANADGSDTKSVVNYIQVNEPVIAPVADFAADNTTITEGQDVTFSDKSANNPTSWKWTFDGGEPATSTLKNPKVKYNAANSYRVTLTVTNDAGVDTKIVDNYVQVEQYVATYCTPSVVAADEWIAAVEIDGQRNSSGASGYSDLTSFGFDLESGANQNIILTPGFSARSQFEYWAVWIDLDQDMVFSDSERLLSSSKSKSSVSGSIYIPAGLNITTRMRVAMSPTAPTACDVLTGEVEDYTIRIFEPAPVADFTASSTSVSVGESVQFTNTSLYNPTSLVWNFYGINPSSSTDPNPVVSYSSPGEYVVTLVASNELGTSQKSMTISVVDGNTTTYCTPTNISSIVNYIRRLVFAGSEVNSGADGYSLSGTSFDNIEAGQVYPVDLSPLSSTTRNFWRIWIDFNQDGVFDDATETVLALNNKKGTVSDNILIPSYVSGTTRMRVAMKVGSAPAACEDDFVGEVEDYTITINEALPQMQASASNPFGEIGTQSEIRVYPNPTSDYINISLEMVEPDDSYTIYTIGGAILQQNSIITSNTRVDLSEYPSGIYLVRVNNNGQLTNKKIIKEN